MSTNRLGIRSGLFAVSILAAVVTTAVFAEEYVHIHMKDSVAVNPQAFVDTLKSIEGDRFFVSGQLKLTHPDVQRNYEISFASLQACNREKDEIEATIFKPSERQTAEERKIVQGIILYGSNGLKLRVDLYDKNSKDVLPPKFPEIEFNGFSPINAEFSELDGKCGFTFLVEKNNNLNFTSSAVGSVTLLNVYD